MFWWGERYTPQNNLKTAKSYMTTIHLLFKTGTDNEYTNKQKTNKD